MKLKSLSTLLLTSALSVSTAFAQERLQHLDHNDGQIFLNLRNQKIQSDIDAQRLAQLLNLSNGNHFVSVRSYTDKLGVKHSSYQQYYNQHKIDGAVLMVHEKDGYIQSINGSFLPATLVNTTVSFDEERAAALAQEALEIKTVLRHYAPELMIIKSETTGDAHLTYAVRVDGYTHKGQLIMRRAFLDAQNGQLLETEELMAHSHTPASAHTLLSGVREIATDDVGNGTYRLYDNNRKIHTLNAAASETGGGAWQPLFLDAKEYINNSTEWGAKPAVSSIRLTNVSNNLLQGLGINTGNFPMSMLGYADMMDTTLFSWPNVHINSTNVPITGRNFYHFFNDTDNLMGMFAKVNVASGDVTEIITFPINTTATTGTFPWTDAEGSGGFYTIDSLRNPAIDVHWGIAQAYDYYVEKFGRYSYDGDTSMVINYMNGIFPFTASSGIPSQNNAMALQSPYNVMLYGMGDGINTNPFVALDVTGHEYTHLVIAENGHNGLRYRGESGALNEAFADIFGTSIEFYAKGNDGNWLIGEDVYMGNYYMRSMSNPKARQYPNTYMGQYWASTASSAPDNGGVHTNSSVANYWYYLVAQGGSGTNDNGYAYDITGIGLEKAEQIAYHTLMNYLPYNANFQQAYTGSLQAVQDLYGADTTSAEYVAVKYAWFAVGLGEGTQPSGISNVIKGNELMQIFPNPVNNGQFTIQSAIDANIDAQIVNMMGQSVQKVQIRKGINNINVGQLAAGVYNISYSHEGKKYSHRVTIL